jgi:hypothetical protein
MSGITSSLYSTENLDWSADFDDFGDFLQNYTAEEANPDNWPGTKYEHFNSLTSSETGGSGEDSGIDAIMNGTEWKDWQRSFSDQIAPSFKIGMNFGDTPEEIHWHHRLFMTFYLKYSMKKVKQKRAKDLALWQGFYEKFAGYGCYCFNDGPVVKGEGKPVDRIDTTCRQLMRCERCVQIDRENEDLPVDCDNHRGYHYRAKKSATTGDAFIYCHKRNDPCQRAACECDRAFAIEMAVAIDSWSQEHVDIVKKDGFCEKPEQFRRSEFRGKSDSGNNHACCGVYPDRMPYLAVGPRQCCGNVLYTASTRECCSADTSMVSPKGMCAVLD